MGKRERGGVCVFSHCLFYCFMLEQTESFFPFSLILIHTGSTNTNWYMSFILVDNGKESHYILHCLPKALQPSLIHLSLRVVFSIYTHCLLLNLHSVSPFGQFESDFHFHIRPRFQRNILSNYPEVVPLCQTHSLIGTVLVST